MKTKEEIAQVLKNIKENEALAVAEIPPDVQFKDVVGCQINREAAAQRVQELKYVYGEYIAKHLGGIILKGDRKKQEAFADLAKKVGGTFNFDTNDLYEKMTDNAYYMMGGGGTLTADQLAMVFAETRLFARSQLGITRLREPDCNWMFNYSWSTNHSFAEGIRRSFFLTDGITLTREALLKAVREDAFKNPVPRTTVPVVMLGVKDAEDAAFAEFFSHGYIVVDVDAVEATEENVVKTFTELRDIIKTKTAPKETTNG